MTARIAPVWNTMEEIYLINNRDFLTTKGPQEGIKYNISVNRMYSALQYNYRLKLLYIFDIETILLYCSFHRELYYS